MSALHAIIATVKSTVSGPPPTTFAGVWAAVAVLPAARGIGGSFGETDDLMMFSGLNSLAATVNTSTYFNGTSWAARATTAFAAASYCIGAGSSSDALANNGGGGGKTNNRWNGTAFSAAPANANAHNNGGGGFGTGYGACALAGGTNVAVNITDLFNGTAWTAGASLNTATLYGNSCLGTVLDGMSLGKFAAGIATPIERYNSSVWTTLVSSNLQRAQAGCGGTPSSALLFGGTNPNASATATTEYFNGTAWASSGNLTSTAHRFPGMAGKLGSGGALTAMAAGGSPVNTVAERFT